MGEDWRSERLRIRRCDLKLINKSYRFEWSGLKLVKIKNLKLNVGLRKHFKNVSDGNIPDFIFSGPKAASINAEIPNMKGANSLAKEFFFSLRKSRIFPFIIKARKIAENITNSEGREPGDLELYREVLLRSPDLLAINTPVWNETERWIALIQLLAYDDRSGKLLICGRVDDREDLFRLVPGLLFEAMCLGPIIFGSLLGKIRNKPPIACVSFTEDTAYEFEPRLILNRILQLLENRYYYSPRSDYDAVLKLSRFAEAELRQQAEIDAFDRRKRSYILPQTSISFGLNIRSFQKPSSTPINKTIIKSPARMQLERKNERKSISLTPTLERHTDNLEVILNEIENDISEILQWIFDDVDTDEDNREYYIFTLNREDLGQSKYRYIILSILRIDPFGLYFLCWRGMKGTELESKLEAESKKEEEESESESEEESKEESKSESEKESESRPLRYHIVDIEEHCKHFGSTIFYFIKAPGGDKNISDYSFKRKGFKLINYIPRSDRKHVHAQTMKSCRLTKEGKEIFNALVQYDAFEYIMRNFDPNDPEGFCQAFAEDFGFNLNNEDYINIERYEIKRITDIMPPKNGYIYRDNFDNELRISYVIAQPHIYRGSEMTIRIRLLCRKCGRSFEKSFSKQELMGNFKEKIDVIFVCNKCKREYIISYELETFTGHRIIEQQKRVKHLSSPLPPKLTVKKSRTMEYVAPGSLPEYYERTRPGRLTKENLLRILGEGPKTVDELRKRFRVVSQKKLADFYFLLNRLQIDGDIKSYTENNLRYYKIA
ncbi:MAG: hypothetical protein ACTSRP_05270 [Candidatus Helarchaeota archaeon]